MSDQQEIDTQLQLLQTHRRTLGHYLSQRAMLGAAFIPPAITHGIDEARGAIRHIKNNLRSQGVPVEDHPDDEPPAAGATPAAIPIPACPPPSAARLVGRQAILDQLIQRLTTGAETLAISAVRGLPGVGKTELLRSLGGDTRIVTHFTSGVLYAELGPAADLALVLRRWIVELGREPPRSDDAETLAAVVRATLHERRALLLIDDVWESSLRVAIALRDCASPACRVLASSRSPQLAQELAKGSQPLTLDVLDPAPALELLRLHAPNVISADEAGAARLAAALGHLPLALKLAGRLLANDRRSSQPCAALLATWHSRLDQLRGYERRPGVADEQLSLDAIIGMSYGMLPDDATRAAAAALATFGATPLDWDWDAMAAVWQTDEATTAAQEQALMSSGLLEFDDATRRYSLHQIVHAFLARYTDPATYELHASYYATLMERCDSEIGHESTIDAALTTLDDEIGQIERGQEQAASAIPTTFWDALWIDYAFACFGYFKLRGRYEQLIAWSKDGEQAAQRQDRVRDVAGLLNNIAIVYQVTGRYNDAVKAYSESLELKRQHSDEGDQALTLNNLGSVYRLQGRYDDAIAYYQQSLDIKQRIGDTTGTASTLGNLGNVYQLQGRYDDAIAHYQQNLNIFQSIGDTAGTARTLGNLGNVYQLQGRYDDAIAHFQQSLDIKQRIGDTAGTARTLGNLGVVYQLQGRYDDAIAHYQQSLDITQRIGDIAGIANTSWNLGTLYESQGDLAAALPLIEQAMQIAERIGMPRAKEWKAEVEELRAKSAGEEAAEPPSGG